MGKGKNINPADAQRKKDAKRAKKRNQLEKAATKEFAAMDADGILEELKSIAKREGQGFVEPMQSKRKRTLLEMHKTLTLRTKHDAKLAGAKTASAPAPSSAARPSTGGASSIEKPSFRVGGSGNQAKGLSQYELSVQRLKRAQAEEEREKKFQELLNVQLSATPIGKEIVEAPEQQQHYAAVSLKPQKMKSSSNNKRKKIIETDALGNVVVSAPKAVVATTPRAAASGALGLLSGYGSGAESTAKKAKEAEIDPYDQFMAELGKSMN